MQVSTAAYRPNLQLKYVTMASMKTATVKTAFAATPMVIAFLMKLNSSLVPTQIIAIPMVTPLMTILKSATTPSIRSTVITTASLTH